IVTHSIELLCEIRPGPRICFLKFELRPLKDLNAVFPQVKERPERCHSQLWIGEAHSGQPPLSYVDSPFRSPTQYVAVLRSLYPKKLLVVCRFPLRCCSPFSL